MIETQRHEDTKGISENPLSYTIIGAAIEVHRTLGGPGLLESIYESALCHELSLQGLKIRSQVPVVLVDDRIIVEVKATKGKPYTSGSASHIPTINRSSFRIVDQFWVETSQGRHKAGD